MLHRYDQAQYPRTVKIAYPKAGSPIGEPQLYVYDLGLDASLRLDAPTELVDTYIYIYILAIIVFCKFTVYFKHVKL